MLPMIIAFVFLAVVAVMSMMNVDLIVHGGAAAARNGLTALPTNEDDKYKTSAINRFVNNQGNEKFILAQCGVSAAIANILQQRWQFTDSGDWFDQQTSNIRDQTGTYEHDYPNRECTPWAKGRMIAAEIDNTNNAQVDQIGYFVADAWNEKLDFGKVGSVIPKDYHWYRFTGALTQTAALWSDVLTLTPITFNPEDGVNYHIAAMKGNGATGLWGRLKHRVGPDQNRRPGFLYGNTAVPDKDVITYQDFGTFIGDSYPIPQVISVAADSVQELSMLIKKTV